VLRNCSQEWYANSTREKVNVQNHGKRVKSRAVEPWFDRIPVVSPRFDRVFCFAAAVNTDRLSLPLATPQLESDDTAASAPYTAGKEMLVKACRRVLVITVL